MASPSRNKNWAVRVPSFFETIHDILPSSPNMLESSPSPFAVKICTLPHGLTTTGLPQPLYYVTKAAAQDRAVGKYPMNGEGVRPGWYMAGAEGCFHVHAGPFKDGEYGEPSENGIVVTLRVDGHDTKKRSMYRKKGKVLKGPPATFKGFVRSTVTEAGSWIENSRIDLFSFENILDASEEKKHTPSSYGTISMQIEAGVLYKQKVYDHPHISNYDYQKGDISAKTVAREGRSIRVGSTASKMEKKKISEWGVGCLQEVEEARIIVSVRSQSWLHSRLIIDHNNQPFKYVDFVRVMHAREYSAAMKRVQALGDITNDIEGPRKKRQRAKKESSLQEVGQLSEKQSVEVIDLT